MTPQAAEDCRTLAEVRAAIDALDASLVDLLARRFAYMRAAARIKPERTAVRDEPRKAEVIAAARRRAASHDIPEEAVGAMWESLVEASIAYELAAWDQLHGGT